MEMQQELHQYLVFHRLVGLAADVRSEFRFGHMDRRLDVTAAVVFLQKTRRG
jgi:hypothetical protein